MATAPQLFPIEVVYQIGSILYAVIHDTVGGDAYWNNTTKAFETFNAGHWADYAIPLTDPNGIGYYRGAFPTEIQAAVDAILMSEGIYVQSGSSPSVGDAPAAALNRSQGVNVAALLGDFESLLSMLWALTTEQQGTVTSVPAANQVADSSAPSSNLDNYVGRVLIFADGTSAQQAYRITGYDQLSGTFTVSQPFLNTPGIGDHFIIV